MAVDRPGRVATEGKYDELWWDVGGREGRGTSSGRSGDGTPVPAEESCAELAQLVGSGGGVARCAGTRRLRARLDGVQRSGVAVAERRFIDAPQVAGRGPPIGTIGAAAERGGTCGVQRARRDGRDETRTARNSVSCVPLSSPVSDSAAGAMFTPSPSNVRGNQTQARPGAAGAREGDAVRAVRVSEAWAAVARGLSAVAVGPRDG